LRNSILKLIYKFIHKRKHHRERYSFQEEISSKSAYNIPIVRLNISNFYNSVSYQQIHRATNKIFSNTNKLPVKYNSNEVQAACNNYNPIITREVTSAYFADMVLDEVDRNFKNYCLSINVNYYRYMDDLFFLCNEETFLKIEKYVMNTLNTLGFQAKLVNKELLSQDKQKMKAIFYNYKQNLLSFKEKEHLDSCMITADTISCYMNYLKYIDFHFYKEAQLGIYGNTI